MSLRDQIDLLNDELSRAEELFKAAGFIAPAELELPPLNGSIVRMILQWRKEGKHWRLAVLLAEPSPGADPALFLIENAPLKCRIRAARALPDFLRKLEERLEVLNGEVGEALAVAAKFNRELDQALPIETTKETTP